MPSIDMRSFALATTVSLALVSGCSQPPSASKPAPGPGATGGSASSQQAGSTGSAMVGVQPTKLAAIVNQAKQLAAATLSTELGLELRAQHTLRDGALLAGMSATPQRFALLDNEDRRGESAGANHAAVGVNVRGGAKAGDQGAAGPSGRMDASASATATSPAATSAAWPGSHGQGKDAQGHDDHADNADNRSNGDPETADDQGASGARRPGDHPSGEQGDADEAAAKDAWKKLSRDDRHRVEAARGKHEAALTAKLSAKLGRKAKLFTKAGADVVTTAADGGKDVTTTFTIDNGQGKRTVTVARKFDAAGSLVQTVEHLSGTATGGVAVTADQTRTVAADGSASVKSDTKLTIGGVEREIKWDKQIALDGTTRGTGTITRPDGTTVALTAGGKEDGVESVAAQDGAAGVSVKVDADAAAGTATASVEAGKDGAASLKLNADEDDGDRNNADDQGGNHDDGQAGNHDNGNQGNHEDADRGDHGDRRSDRKDPAATPAAIPVVTTPAATAAVAATATATATTKLP